MERKRARKHKCKECGWKFDEYRYLKDHFASVHELKFKKIKEFIEDTRHIGEINE